MSAEAFLDTNVLVYALDEDEPRKREVARTLLASAQPGSLMLSAQVLGELYVTVTRRLAKPLTPEQAAEVVEWLTLLPVVPIDAALVKRGAEISREAQISYWDGLVVAAAAHGGCERLLSEDLNDGQEIASVRIEDPFK
ncbi:MAG TPA: PIN domain-containing protein [Solirubrobacteraceae bacterium]|nr:PIN domain-containing protein [Solirubrobacteraceae bacterium]